MSEKLTTGSEAPDFTAPVAGGDYRPGDTVTLSSLRGRTVVLYFYPMDNTPGCTKQACSLRDSWDAVKQKALVFGVNTNSVASHEKFIAKHHLPFPLISDADAKIVEAYGVRVGFKLAGFHLGWTSRSTFVVGPDGKISGILHHVNAGRHVEQLLPLLG